MSLGLGFCVLNAQATPPAAAPTSPSSAVAPPLAPPPPFTPSFAVEPPAASALDADAMARPLAQSEVKRMLINPFGEIDGLRLADGTIVKFPPHLADELLRIAQPGQTVRIVGRLDAPGIVKADAIINIATAQTVYDQPPAAGAARPLPPHLRAQKLQEQRVEGYIDKVLVDRRGEANGVILTDGSIARFSPDTVPVTLRPGEPFAAAGLGTRNGYGTSLEVISIGTRLSALQPLYNRAP
ncbi:hypothetical protein FXN63_13085 [Pigmentiphaga aceris]|uniref:Uncharacterized protein n=1 Tax=Pigmentiphaga aceris TaxID=1940612 RepID=A0A5C0B5B2_9BURK|nr:hypothetical protein FXN63_13085 [Pigmentiphaga aceris]